MREVEQIKKEKRGTTSVWWLSEQWGRKVKQGVCSRSLWMVGSHPRGTRCHPRKEARLCSGASEQQVGLV